ncbi:MAG: hypothetical protein LQ351_007152 [Letrouitia transgressa]|nr:MAG: hypothetical protein LQ351_007152 [Letrouitia transgressa]
MSQRQWPTLSETKPEDAFEHADQIRLQQREISYAAGMQESVPIRRVEILRESHTVLCDKVSRLVAETKHLRKEKKRLYRCLRQNAEKGRSMEASKAADTEVQLTEEQTFTEMHGETSTYEEQNPTEEHMQEIANEEQTSFENEERNINQEQNSFAEREQETTGKELREHTSPEEIEGNVVKKEQNSAVKSEMDTVRARSLTRVPTEAASSEATPSEYVPSPTTTSSGFMEATPSGILFPPTTTPTAAGQLHRRRETASSTSTSSASKEATPSEILPPQTTTPTATSQPRHRRKTKYPCPPTQADQQFTTERYKLYKPGCTLTQKLARQFEDKFEIYDDYKLVLGKILGKVHQSICYQNSVYTGRITRRYLECR